MTPPRKRSLSDDEISLINRIADRAADIFGLRPAASRTFRPIMAAYLSAMHTGPDGPLDLVRFLKAPGSGFCHDMTGILGHVNPATGRCAPFFLPRYLQLSSPSLAAMAGLSETPEG